jgi:periplasmic divalent cation tolerance protein
MEHLVLALTTFATRAEAESFARRAVENGAACAQIDGPVLSVYRWNGRVEQSEEWRLFLKIPGSRVHALRDLAGAAHPYDTPQWIEFNADHVAEKYLRWAHSHL